MQSDLASLRITETELERLSGLEVSGLFIGGVFGGTYRRSSLRKPGQLLWLVVTECLVSILCFIFSLPLGLAVVRDAASAINQPSVIAQFLLVTLSFTVLAIIGWNVFMELKAKRLQMFMHLLDAIDQYHGILQAIALLDRLEAVGNQANLSNRSDVLEGLRLTRDNLIAGIMTEKILRENRGLLARRYELLNSIESNLLTLKAIDLQTQATEYAHFVDEAIQIGVSVHNEIQKLVTREPK